MQHYLYTQGPRQQQYFAHPSEAQPSRTLAKLEYGRSPLGGQGLFAADDIPRGTKLIDEHEAWSTPYPVYLAAFKVYEAFLSLDEVDQCSVMSHKIGDVSALVPHRDTYLNELQRNQDDFLGLLSGDLNAYAKDAYRAAIVNAVFEICGYDRSMRPYGEAYVPRIGLHQPFLQPELVSRVRL